jgi:methionyl-tRNA formyltransferase
MTSAPNDLCVLADPYLRAYQARSLENAVAELGIDIPLVIVNNPETPDIDPDLKASAANGRIGFATVRAFTNYLLRERAWALVYAEKKITEQFGADFPSTNRVPVEAVSCFSDAKIRHVTPITDGNWIELPSPTVDLIEANCDVAVRFGFGLIAGDVLSAPEYGVLSFHPADIRRYRGLGTPQAWIDDRETIGVTLQQLTDEIDGGRIVACGETDVTECPTLWEAYENVYDLFPTVLVEGLENLRDPSFEPVEPDSLGPYYPTQSRQSISFAGRTLLKNVKGRASSSLSTR